MKSQGEVQLTVDQAQEVGDTPPHSRSALRRVAVSLHRVWPRCGSLRVARLARGFSSRYECNKCDNVFRGVRMLGMRLQW